MTGLRATAADTHKYLVLAVCCSSLFLVSLDGTIVNVALPSIGQEMHADVATLQWTVDAYLLVLASLLLLSGSLADRVGRKRIFAIGLVVFTSGSLLCSVAPTDGWLIAFRMYQAVGGSALTPVALAIVTNIFTGKTERARVIGIWAAINGIGIAAGPLLGGILVDTVGWRSIFWINVPIGIAAFILTLTHVPESRAAHPRALDPIGQLTAIVFLATLVFAIIETPRRGFASPWIIASAGMSVVAFVALLALERRRSQPLIPLGLFRVRSFTTAFLIAMLGFLAFAGLLFANTLYLQEAHGLPASTAGALMLPLAAGVVICAPVSGRLMGRVGARRPLLIAGFAMTVASLLLFVLTPLGVVALLMVPYAVFGVGYGMLNAPINDTAISDLPDDRAGVAASLISTAKQVGSALGVAIIGATIAASPADEMSAAFDARGWIVWTILTACCAAILALTFPKGATTLVAAVATHSAAHLPQRVDMRTHDHDAGTAAS